MNTIGAAYTSALRAHGGGNYSVVDTVMPDMIELIDAHWYQYPPLEDLWQNILMVCITIFMIISLVGNSIVMSIFTSTKSLKTPSNYLVVNLAFADFFMMFTMGPPMIMNSYYRTWIFGPLGCQLYGMAGSMAGCMSIWSMTMIAFDRYNVIVKGISATPLTKNGALARIAFIWAWSAVWTIFPLVGWSRYTPEGSLTACGTDYLSNDINTFSYLVVYSISVYWFPLLLICYSYFFIVQAVSQHEKNMRDQAKKMKVTSLRSQEAKQTNTEMKLAKICLFTIALWFMAWTPYLIINYKGVFKLGEITPLQTIWSSIFAKANAVYNPIVYAISHPKYKAALFKKYPSLDCSSVDDDDDSKSTVTEGTATQEATA